MTFEARRQSRLTAKKVKAKKEKSGHRPPKKAHHAIEVTQAVSTTLLKARRQCRQTEKRDAALPQHRKARHDIEVT